MDDQRLSAARDAFERHMGVAWTRRDTTGLPAVLSEFGEINLARAYTDSWAREGLDLRMKSLLTLAILGSQQAEALFKTHVKAAEHVGVTREEIVELLIHLGAYAGAPAASLACGAAVAAWTEIDADASAEPEASTPPSTARRGRR